MCAGTQGKWPGFRGRLSKLDPDPSYFGFTVGSPPGVPGGGITGVEAVPLSGGARTLRSPICGGFITPLD
jgi:hypothetical protein